MGAEQWISAVSAAIFVALGGLSATRAGKTPLAAPTAVLCAVLFAYDGFELLDALSSAPIWSWLDAAAAAAVAPPTLYLVATFLGQRRRLRVPLMAASAYFCAIALGSALPILWPDAAGFPNGPLWALAMLGGIAPSFVWAGVLLRRHAREADPEERGRTLLLALALLIGVGSVSSDLLAIAGEAHTRIAAFGLVASAVFLTALALRARVVEGTLGLFAANAVALAALTGLGQLMLWAWVGHSTVLVLISGITLTLAALAALRPLANAVAEERARTAHLATLGRFSAQMAHDLKNPLAAIKGSAQFLIEERTQGRSLDAQGEFVDLILEQAERLGRVVDQYQRLGRVEVVRQDVDVAALVEEVVAAQRAAAAETIEIGADTDPSVARAHLDRDLVLGALENLVRNAREALGAAKGSVRVSSVVEGELLHIDVSDDGPGMDARTRERVFDDFFTTKTSGSGLGLAFVGRVARAHGGSARILPSEGGRGTRVRMSLRTS